MLSGCGGPVPQEVAGEADVFPGERRRVGEQGVQWDCPAFVDTEDAFQRGVLPCPRPVLRMPLSFVVR